MMTRDLLIAGAGGFARETVAAVRAVNEREPTYRLLGFLDDDPAKHGTQWQGVTVLGGMSIVDEHPDAQVIVCVGNPRNYGARAQLVARLGLPDQRYATVVHPSVTVGEGCLVGPGSVLLAQSVLTADVTIGRHVAMMPHNVLTHDNVIEDFVIIAAAVLLGGGVRLSTGCYVGAGAMIREYLTIGTGSLVGMGSVVLRDVPPGEVWEGTPARRLRAANLPDGGLAGVTTVTVGGTA
jgi:sugar O-acyltransferase (sialic acid O-acetyltransferase NeuD family)